MGREQLEVAAEATAAVAPEIVWSLVADANTYAAWGPWDRSGYRPHGPGPSRVGAIQVLRSSTRSFGRRATSVEEILQADDARTLAYTVVGGIPVRNYRAVVQLTPVPGGTRVRWSATWDSTARGRMVHRALGSLYPEIVARLVAAAESRAEEANRSRRS